MSSPPSLSPARVKRIIPTDVAQRKNGITFRRFPDPKLFFKKGKKLTSKYYFAFPRKNLGLLVLVMCGGCKVQLHLHKETVKSTFFSVFMSSR